MQKHAKLIINYRSRLYRCLRKEKSPGKACLAAKCESERRSLCIAIYRHIVTWALFCADTGISQYLAAGVLFARTGTVGYEDGER